MPGLVRLPVVFWFKFILLCVYFTDVIFYSFNVDIVQSWCRGYSSDFFEHCLCYCCPMHGKKMELALWSTIKKCCFSMHVGKCYLLVINYLKCWLSMHGYRSKSMLSKNKIVTIKSRLSPITLASAYSPTALSGSAACTTFIWNKSISWSGTIIECHAELHIMFAIKQHPAKYCKICSMCVRLKYGLTLG